ncbi:MAG: hypothetical protein JRI23_33835 [Deltaproteobacteria bacterium]|nr:hypothetical protein [Deltaproteobacteria bacterium]
MLLRLGLGVGVAVGLAVGCHSVFGLTDYSVGPSTTQPNSTGTGGAGGATPTCSVAADCPGLDTSCATRTCEAGRCDVDRAAAGTPCTEEGGQVCDGAGSCVECVAPEDCEPGMSCESNLCVGTGCVNGTKDGDETDLDCGGSCPPCANGQACETYEDCESRFCDLGGGAGGAGGGGGGLGVCAPCGDDGDCATAASSWCDPSTAGGTCTDPLGDGSSCDRPAQCQSGHCPPGSGVCCNAACGGECDSCLGADTGGSNGTCGTATACVTCQDQYGAAGSLHEICSATSSDCVLRTALPAGTSCQDVCQTYGGECLSLTDDNPPNSCGVGAALTCTDSSFASVLCTCSHGCGSGPPCGPTETCSGGACS